MSKIRVLLADDHAIVREGVRMILSAQSDIEVVGEASNGEEALRLAHTLQPDMVLMDISMPGINGLEATKALKQSRPDIHILILTMLDDEDYFFRVLSAGASGYVLKGAGSDELLNAVRAVQHGGVYLYPTMAKKLVNDYLQTQAAGASSADPLTPREREVLKLIAGGMTNREIAEALVLSLNTVQTHRLHIMEKLNLHNRSQLIRYALRRGLIEAED